MRKQYVALFLCMMLVLSCGVVQYKSNRYEVSAVLNSVADQMVFTVEDVVEVDGSLVGAIDIVRGLLSDSGECRVILIRHAGIFKARYRAFLEEHGIPYIIRENVADEVMALAVYDGHLYVSESNDISISTISNRLDDELEIEEDYIIQHLLESANRLVMAD